MITHISPLSQQPLTGLVPAAGRGARLGLPYPKELYPIIRANRYKPLAQFIVEALLAAGVRHIIFVINETKHQLIGYFGSGQRFGCHFSYVVQECPAEPNGSTSPGLAHALDAAYHLVGGSTVLFGMPDTLLHPPDVFSRLLAGMQPYTQAALGCFPAHRPEKLGMVDFAPGGAVQAVIDKPPHTSLSYAWGCMAWRPAFSEFLHVQVCQAGAKDFAAILNAAIASGIPLQAVPFPGGQYSDLGTYEEIQELEARSRG